MAAFAAQEVPDEIYLAYCNLLAYTLETPYLTPATKEVILFDSSIEHLSADMRLYFYALVEIMKNHWGDQINLNGLKISVNSDQLPLLIDYLTKKGYQPQNDFLTAHEGLKKNHEHLLPFYLKLVSSHKGLLDAEGFTRLGIDTPEQEQKYAKTASPVERLCYNNMIKNLLIPAIKKANSEKSTRTQLNDQDFGLLADLLVRATPGTCFEILSLISIDTRPKEKQENLLKLLYKKFEYYLKANPESAADLLTIRFGDKKYTLLDLTSVCNFPAIFKLITDKVPNYMSIDGCLNVPPPHVGLLTAARVAMYQRAAAKTADKPAPNVVNDGNQKRPFP